MTNTTIPNPVPAAQHVGAYFPLRPGTKEPMVMAWQVVVPGQYQAVGSYGEALTADDLILDADPRNYPPGRDVLGEILAKWPDIQPTRTIKTPSGGYHVRTKKPPELALRKEQIDYPGVDFLSKGHYVVGPGTTTVATKNSSAGTYVVEVDAPIKACPLSFLDSLQKAADASVNGADINLANTQPFIDSMKVADPPVQGSRGINAYKHACRGRDLALPLETVYAALRDWWNPRGMPPETDAVIYQQCERAYKYAKNALGSNTAEAKFTPDMAVAPVMMSADELAKHAPSPFPASWSSINLPWGFSFGENGWIVELVGKDKKMGPRVCGPAVVVAHIVTITEYTTGLKSEPGILVEFRDRSGKIKRHAIDRQLLHMDRRALAAELDAAGLQVVPGKDLELAKFLSGFNPINQAIYYSQTGWAPNTGDKLVFILPAGATDASFQYRNETSKASRLVASSGTLDGWIEQVFAKVQNTPNALYAILKSLSAPLLKFQPIYAGEHLSGASSTGKTTLLRVSASCWGRGAVPGTSGSFVLTYKATGNGIESDLSQFNDLPVHLDELGMSASKDFEREIYSMADGQSKSTMTQSRESRPQLIWRTLIIGSGEKTVKTLVEHSGSTNAMKAGAMVRMLDRELLPNQFGSADASKAVQQACAEYYGTLGPAFVNAICERYTAGDFTEYVKRLFKSAHERLCNQLASISSTSERALERFALAEVAGMLAVEFGLIESLTVGMVRQAVDTVVAAWAPSAANMDDVPRAIDALREAIIRDFDICFRTSGRLSVAGTDRELELREARRELAGKYDETRECLWVTKAYVRKITGRDADEIGKELDAQSWLQLKEKTKDKNGKEGERLDPQFTVSPKMRSRGYAIKLSFFGAELAVENAQSESVIDWSSCV